MKSLTIVLMTLISFSSFAETVKCEIYKIQKDGNSVQVDSLLLGQVGAGQYIAEEGREITKMEGTFISAQLNSGSLNIAILKGSSTRIAASDILLEAGTSSTSLSVSSQKEKIAVLCLPTK